MNVTSDVKTAADAPLSSKYLPGIEVYQNQADYSARNGGAACPWNPAKRPKFWADPSAGDLAEDEGKTYTVLSVNVQNGVPVAGPDGGPLLRSTTMVGAAPALVNIPPSAALEAGQGTIGAAYPVPLAPLSPSEVLIFDKISFGQQVLVRDMVKYSAIQAVNDGNPQITSADRALWRAIAAKVGVTLCLVLALIVLSVPAAAQAIDPPVLKNFAALGPSFCAACDQKVAITGLYARLISPATKTWEFNAVDAVPSLKAPYPVTVNMTAGVAQQWDVLLGKHKLSLFTPISAGFSQSIKATGWAWSTGVLVPIKTKYVTFTPHTRVLKSSVSNGDGYTWIFGVLAGPGRW